MANKLSVSLSSLEKEWEEVTRRFKAKEITSAEAISERRRIFGLMESAKRKRGSGKRK